jgi:hypothetical protein
MLANAHHDVTSVHPLRRGARRAAAAAVLALAALAPAGAAQAADLQANTGNFGSVFNAAQAGDVIHLAAGDYGTFNGGSKSGPVTLSGGAGAAKMYANIGASQNLVFDGVTIAGLSLSGGRNITIRNSIFTAAATIGTPTSTPNANIVLDHNTFSGINVCSTCYEGRLAVRGYNNTQPVGVTVSNNLFGPGGDSDGVQIIGNAYGVQIGPGNEFRGLAQVSAAHTDPIQLYGSSHTLITGNWLHDNATGIMAPDGSDTETITNNVIQTTGYPWPIVMGAADSNVVTHNTLPGSQGTIEVDKSNGGAASTGNVIKDNIVTNVANATGGKPQGSTVDYNLSSGATIGAHDIKGKPTYSGGSSPTTYAGYLLASSSAGRNAASDGTNMGITSAPATPTTPGAPGTGGTPTGATTPAPATTPATTASDAGAAGDLGAGPTITTRRIPRTGLHFGTVLRFSVKVAAGAAAIDRVSFMVDDVWVGTDRTSPYSLTWRKAKHLRYGAHVLRIRAFAKNGSSSTVSVKLKRVRYSWAAFKH